ncbi:MAG: hypothetical protein DBP02_20640 [gamma proteobacterium symbiont of Ctena orbiculata]|nr:MAG: hypothetical protein DBP02_20640 [gamma proteobacterium symbiont of Ctena orbiculata]
MTNMKLDKLFRRLFKSLDKGKKGGEDDLDKIDQLLKRLGDRKDHLRHRLKKEKRVCKQKRLKAELKIVEIKLKKAKKRRKQLGPT